MAHLYDVKLTGSAEVTCYVQVYADSDDEAMEIAKTEYSPGDIEVDYIEDWYDVVIESEDFDDTIDE